MLAMIRTTLLPALCVALLFSVAGISAAQQPAWQPAPGHITLDLWPHGAPDAQPSAGPEADMTTPKDHVIAGRAVLRLGNVSNPTITHWPDLVETWLKTTGMTK